ncbi:MAG: peptide chain release factor 2 [Acholeplasmataceae bacterium]|nr:peptide chain release factor 2 [Acholeplasmataceae bacterium]
MERYEVYKKLDGFKIALDDLTKAIQPNKLKIELNDLEEEMLNPNFWQDQNQAKKTTKRIGDIKDKLEVLFKLLNSYEELLEWFAFSKEQTESWDILEADIKNLESKIEEFQIEILLSEPYDDSNAILEIHPGAGGTESQDFASMLYRMYLRYAQQKNFKVEILDYQAGDEAGIKSVSLLIKGSYAYGRLKSEIGVHRLVRISPFDANKKRHTSFSSVDVYPEIDDTSNIIIKDDDIKVDVYRSSGAGGQSVNTTDSAVRITHLPTNIVVTCQNERSQIKNKETAMNILKSKLMQIEIERRKSELSELKGEQKDIAWGSQIRSYVMQPYQLVKDHRTNAESSQVDLVFDGDLDLFIIAFLKR